jgi:flagellar biosynthesis/type III secretory pathway protein FliH
MKPDVQPFLTTVTRSTAPLGAALPAIAVEAKPSPWSPKPVAAASMAAPSIDADAVRAEACERGRAEGLAETEKLRAQLAAAVTAFEAARAAIAPVAAAQIAEAATTVIGAWIEKAPPFAAVISKWTAATTEPATARVHPEDAAALREAIGEAAIQIEEDPAIARGDIQIRAAAMELALVWSDRLVALREAIQAALC